MSVRGDDPPAVGPAARRDGRAYVEAVIRNRAFSLVYQPIVHLDRGTVSGVEALCRFHDARPPDLWFQQCRELGLAAEMDLAIIAAALDDIDDLPPDGYLAVNVALPTLAATDELAALLLPALDRRQLVIELTEHIVVDDYSLLAAQLAPLRRAGVLLAVDDAGAGYSTFQHVVRLRPDLIKMDRSLTASIDEDVALRALATALAIFAGEIGASVVAEGIETPGELAAIRSAGITRGQGFGLARPQPLPLAPLDYELPDDEQPPFLVDVSDGRPRIDTATDATVAVVAHGLINSLAAARVAVHLLSQGHGTLSVERHRALCAVVDRQTAHVTGVLQDLVQGLTPEAAALLAGLERN